MLAALSACKGKPAVRLEGTEWKLVELAGASDAAFAADNDTFNFTLAAEEHSLYGAGACNRFFGNYSVGDGDRLKLEPMGMTRMACPDMELEDRFVRMLYKVDRYSIEGDRLTLYAGNEKLAEMKAAAEPAE